MQPCNSTFQPETRTNRNKNKAVARLISCCIFQTLSVYNHLTFCLFLPLWIFWSLTLKGFQYLGQVGTSPLQEVWNLLASFSDKLEEKCLKYLWCILRTRAHSERGVAYELISRQTAAPNQYCALNHFKTKTSFSSFRPCGSNTVFHTTCVNKNTKHILKIRGHVLVKDFQQSRRNLTPCQLSAETRSRKVCETILGISVKLKTKLWVKGLLQGTNKLGILFLSWSPCLHSSGFKSVITLYKAI